MSSAHNNRIKAESKKLGLVRASPIPDKFFAPLMRALAVTNNEL